MTQYVFDGSFSGLLCCVFEAFQMKEQEVKIIQDKYHQPDAFMDFRTVFTDEQKAKRVWEGFAERTDSIARKRFYYAYLSEQQDAFQHLFNFAVYLFKNGSNAANNYGNADVLAVSRIAKSVGREKHRMEAFIRFKKAADGLFYALVKPDFNVLPVIRKHFKDRYADQPWLIYDEKRKYGIYYDTQKVDTVTIALSEVKSRANAGQLPVLQINDEKEALYDLLWKDYFKSTNITERKNTRLHLQHVPKRYWQYLNEK